MLKGSCLCGRVRYETSAAPLFGVVCHCRDCQRATGNGYVPVFAVPKTTLRVRGEAKSYTVTGGSGQPTIRHFCPNCGSLLFGEPLVAAGLITLYLGAMDDPPEFKPDYVQYTRQRPGWCRIEVVAREFEGAGG
jgi:hypothetical protein